MAIAFKQHAESIRTSNDAPQPYAIAQEYRDRRSFPLQMLEEGILKTVNIVVCHLVGLGELNETFWSRQIAVGELAPRAGFEPATNRLTAGCSTAELPGTKAARARVRL
jgi:hypothetical protein